MDCFSDALNRIRFRGTIYSRAELSAPWGLSIPGEKGHVFFMMVLHGSCIVTFDQINQQIYPTGGELILAPSGVPCVVQDHSSSPILSVKELGSQPPRGQVFKHGGNGALTSAIMGCFQFEAAGRNPLIESLPGVIHLKAEQLHSEPWLETTLRQLASETTHFRPGTDILISRLTDVIFVQTMRAYISQIKNCTETPGWLKALADPEVGAALCLIHEDPAAPWTVADLANKVGLSRTSFATKFAALVKQSPIEYLTSWRMQRALSLMEQGEDNMNEIACAVGYTSESAFAKAFKRELGEAPGGFRKRLSQVN